MFTNRPNLFLPFAFAASFPSLVSAQVEEWFIDKAITYQQTENDTAPTEAFIWTIELAVVTGNPGDANSATISGGGIAGSLPLEWDDGEWLYERNFDSQAEMDALFPSGQSYTITLSGGTLGNVSQTFNLGPANYPAIPYLTGADLGASQNILPGSGFNFHWNSPGPNATGVSLEIEDPFIESEIADFEFDGAPLPTSQLLGAAGLTAGNTYSGYLSFINSTTNNGAGGFGVEGYIGHSRNLSFDIHQMLAAATNKFVGAWTFGDTTQDGSGVIVLLPNGVYVHIEDVPPGEEFANDGVETGTYSINEAGILTSTVTIENNGDVGLSDPTGIRTVSVDGDELTFTDGDGTFMLNRVTFDPANPLVGAWRLIDNNSTDDKEAVVVLLGNGYYFHGEAGNPEPGGSDGIERGTYTFLNGRITGTPIVDTNGEFGLSDPIIGFDDLTIIDNVSMKLFDGEHFFLRRVSNASILPEWRVNKGRNFNQTADNTAPTTAEFWDVWAYLETRNQTDIGSATINGAAIGSPRALEDEGDGEWTYEKDYPNQGALDAEFPDNQIVTITVTGGAMGTRVQTLNLGASSFPPVPYLIGTIFTDARNINPAAPFTFSWNNPDSSSTQLVLTSEPDEDGEEYFYEKDVSGSATGANVAAGTLDPGISGYGYLEFGRGVVNDNGASGFGTSGFSGRQSITLNFAIATQGGDDGGLGDAAADAGLTGDDALPGASPFDDGVPNLIKYAFNMNLGGRDNGTLAPGGDSGLPTFSLGDDEGVPTFELTFIRRVGSTLTYTAQRSTNLGGFATMTGAVTVEPIAGGEFERVTVSEPCDPAIIPKCFGRVLVTIP